VQIEVIGTFIAFTALIQAPAKAQSGNIGEMVFNQDCAMCHGSNAPADSRAPRMDSLRLEAPESVLDTLANGVMRAQAQRLNPAEVRAVAEYVTGKKLSIENFDASAGMCVTRTSMSDPEKSPHWNGWGGNLSNTRFQPGDQARLPASSIPKLKLKWAFGFPDTSHAWSQPTVAGGRLFVGSQGGRIFALDPKTGCTYWSFLASGAMRTTITIGPRPGRPNSYLAYFSTIPGWVYALDASTGEEVWRARAEDHVSTRTTGSPVLYDGKLYVPVASFEEGMSGGRGYECCTFRGSLSAFDAGTGKLLWKTYTISDPPTVINTGPSGEKVYGPSGGGIWSSPVLDTERRVIYVATGNGFTGPMVDTTDAILALDLTTGKILWKHQVTHDIYLPGCGNRPGAPIGYDGADGRPGGRGRAAPPGSPIGGGAAPAPGGREGRGGRGGGPRRAACPGDENGPDFDFGSSPIIAMLPGKRQVLLAGQKSGLAWAFDPENKGDTLWSYQALATDIPPGNFGGVVWGQALDGDQMYVPVSDIQAPERAGGLHAIKVSTGKRVWFSPPVVPLCKLGPGCSAAQAAPPTVIPGVVFAGAADGGLRAYSTKDGSVLWTFDTNPSFETVNKVKANGGSIISAGAVVVDGMVFITSGYGSHNGRAGNVLLAFGTD
jgi:polyvinyl alcohol dehydrogenase (cytochrome)